MLIDDERYDRLRREAERTGAPIGAIVRNAIDWALPAGRDPGSVGSGAAAAGGGADAGSRLARDEARHARRTLWRVAGGRALRRFLYDTNIFMYAVGDDHPHRELCRAIIERAQTGRLLGEASPDLLQELLHQRARRTGDRAGACALTRAVARLCRFDDLDESDALRALDLFDRHERLSARDAFFAAFASIAVSTRS